MQASATVTEAPPAAELSVPGQYECVTSEERLRHWVVLLAGAPLVLRRIRPMWTLAATTGAVAAFVAAGYPFGPVLVALFVAIYSAAARSATRRSKLAVGAAVLALAVRLAWDPAGLGPGSVVPYGSWLAVPWSLGTVVRLRREAAVRDRREVATRAATEERLRVAREVHDVAGHGLAVIAMQAGVALHVLDRRPEQARVALEEIRAASREALDGLRATLEVGTADPDRRVRPVGLGELDGLLARMRQAGLAVRLAVSGERRPLPADADLAAYRILQESLTNVLRHAGASTATVSLDYAQDALSVEVVDDGAGPADGATGGVADGGTGGPTGGRGIAGMRDRAVATGGTLDAGPRPGGGFSVRASLPVGRPG
jgi:signal transduction histidine kinase